MMNLPPQVLTALAILEENNFDGFVVGGCVRDFLLEKIPSDFDVTTNALPQAVVQIFKDYKVIETGLKHGTVTVIIDSLHIEITTYHSLENCTEKIFSAGKIEDDLAKRDFTINAIAYSPKVGFVDPFGGKIAIENKKIEAVGSATERFSEDPLRILRALRFATTLGFEIEKSTAEVMFFSKEKLKNISVERIHSEFCKALLGENFKKVFLNYSEILGAVLPEILPMVNFNQNNPHHIYDVFTHSLVAVENVPAVLHLKLAAFFHDIGKPSSYSVDEKNVGHFYGHPEKSFEITKEILTRLKVDNATKEKVLTLVKFHDAPILNDCKNIKKWLRKISAELFFDLILLKKADNLAQNPEYNSRQAELETVRKLAEKIVAEEACFKLKDLAVGGNDLLNLGYCGKEIGEILNLFLDKVISEELQNDRDVLLNSLKQE